MKEHTRQHHKLYRERCERLRKMIELDAPSSVVVMMAEHLYWTECGGRWRAIWRLFKGWFDYHYGQIKFKLTVFYWRRIRLYSREELAHKWEVDDLIEELDDEMGLSK